MDGGTNKENEQTKAKITIYTHTVFHMGRSHKSADFPTATLHTNFLPNKVTVFLIKINSKMRGPIREILLHGSRGGLLQHCICLEKEFSE